MADAKNICWFETIEWIDTIDPRLKPHYLALSKIGWKFYLAKQKSGWCILSTKVIVIPISILSKLREKPGYDQYYLAHEMAHAFDECKHNHGPEFMTWLKKLCPSEWLHYELEYKPANAMRAGIYHPSLDLL